MKKRKLKSFVLPTLYTLIVIGTFLSIGIINNLALKTVDNTSYTHSLIDNTSTPVIKTEEIKLTIKPYMSDQVKKTASFYQKGSSKEEQEASLLVYEGNYIPSTGCMYESPSEFDVISMFDGTVTKISNDELLGNVIEVTYNTNIVAYYYSVDNLTIKENALVTRGTILGTSSQNKIESDNSSLYVEVYNKGLLINPEDFYNINIDEL